MDEATFLAAVRERVQIARTEEEAQQARDEASEQAEHVGTDLEKARERADEILHTGRGEITDEEGRELAREVMDLRESLGDQPDRQ